MAIHADLETLQAEVSILVTKAEDIVAVLRNAELCESITDFEAYLEGALGYIADLRASVKETMAAAR